MNKSFWFKLKFIMKRVNDRNQVSDIGSQIFPLKDINYAKYVAHIIIPEIDKLE